MTKRDPFRDALDALRDDRAATPDLTRSIMGRLGYMQGSAQVAERRRRRRRLVRGAVVTCALCVITGGLLVHQFGPNARRADETSVGTVLPAALERNVDDMGSALERLRDVFAPPRPRAVPASITIPADEIPDDVDQTAIATLRWL
jgi:hypothetical protein